VTKDQLLQWKEEINANYRDESAAIAKLLMRFDTTRETRSQAIVSASHDAGIVQRRSSKWVEDIIKRTKSSFTISDIVGQLHQERGWSSTSSRDIVRGEILNLRNRGKVKVVEKGKGSRSGVYQTICPI
jgi:hypothetical protein